MSEPGGPAAPNLSCGWAIFVHAWRVVATQSSQAEASISTCERSGLQLSLNCLGVPTAGQFHAALGEGHCWHGPQKRAHSWDPELVGQRASMTGRRPRRVLSRAISWSRRRARRLVFALSEGRSSGGDVARSERRALGADLVLELDLLAEGQPWPGCPTIFGSACLVSAARSGQPRGKRRRRFWPRCLAARP